MLVDVELGVSGDEPSPPAELCGAAGVSCLGPTTTPF